MKKDSLLIIDNFNTTTTRDKLLSVILKYRCRILFTTKSNFSDHSQVTIEEISDHAVLFDLFSRIFKEAAQHRETVEAIMETVHYAGVDRVMASWSCRNEAVLSAGPDTGQKTLDFSRLETVKSSGQFSNSERHM